MLSSHSTSGFHRVEQSVGFPSFSLLTSSEHEVLYLEEEKSTNTDAHQYMRLFMLLSLVNSKGEIMHEKDKALVRQLVDQVINGGELDLVEELFAPELVEPVRQAFTNFRAAFPDWREEIVDMVAEGDRVAVRFRCSGTLQGEFMGAQANGRRQEVDEVFFLRVQDGRFVEYWGLEDNLTRLRQLGVIL